MKVKCCDEILKSNFYPHGRTKENLEENEKTIFPLIYKTYSHGSKEDHFDFLEENGIEYKSNLGNTISFLNYEWEHTYEIDEKCKATLIEVDGIPIKEMLIMLETLYIIHKTEAIKEILIKANWKNYGEKL